MSGGCLGKTPRLGTDARWGSMVHHFLQLLIDAETGKPLAFEESHLGSYLYSVRSYSLYLSVFRFILTVSLSSWATVMVSTHYTSNTEGIGIRLFPTDLHGQRTMLDIFMQVHADIT